MDIIRQNSDYALRMMGHLASSYAGGTVSVRVLAEHEGVSYQFACKILQQLHRAGLVRSSRGPAGGYQLGREPARITMLEVIEAMQGALTVNRCTAGGAGCPRQGSCRVAGKLAQLHDVASGFLAEVTLNSLVDERAEKSVG